MKYLTIPLKRKQIKALAALHRALTAYPGACSLGQVLFRTDGSAVLKVGCITASATKVVQSIAQQAEHVIDLVD